MMRGGFGGMRGGGFGEFLFFDKFILVSNTVFLFNRWHARIQRRRIR